MREVDWFDYYVPFLGFRTVADDEEAEGMGLPVGNWTWRVFEFTWMDFGMVFIAWPKDK
jgi:hypothetical protein